MSGKRAWAGTITALMILGVTAASAEIINDTNWADQVSDYSANIQNYGGELMSATTEWWLTGPSDADVDGNGYAWDAVDQDTVGGWRAALPNEYITMYWETGVPDLDGDDLSIRLYGGPGAAADVFASMDGAVFSLLGTIGGGTAGYFQDVTFDLAGLLAGDMHYLKVVRAASGPQTGMFFDSFTGHVPEPASLPLVVLATLLLRHRRGG